MASREPVAVVETWRPPLVVRVPGRGGEGAQERTSRFGLLRIEITGECQTRLVRCVLPMWPVGKRPVSRCRSSPRDVRGCSLGSPEVGSRHRTVAPLHSSRATCAGTGERGEPSDCRRSSGTWLTCCGGTTSSRTTARSSCRSPCCGAWIVSLAYYHNTLLYCSDRARCGSKLSDPSAAQMAWPTIYRSQPLKPSSALLRPSPARSTCAAPLQWGQTLRV